MNKCIVKNPCKPCMQTKQLIAENENITKLVKNEICRLGIYANLNHINVSKVTDMSDLFYLSSFNGDISRWDVSNVTSMEYMFMNSLFNGDISQWNVANVQSMNSMFFGSKFDRDLSEWNTSNVKNMRFMFCKSNFNGDISKLDVYNVIEMTQIFKHSKFCGDISDWKFNPSIQIPLELLPLIEKSYEIKTQKQTHLLMRNLNIKNKSGNHFSL